MLDCYGRRFGKLDACGACEFAAWCKDAADLPVGSQHVFDERQMEEVSPELISVDPVPLCEEEAPQEEDGEDMARILKDVFIAMSRLADGNDTRLGIILDRIAGLPYETIAKRRGMTKQGVEKHLRTVKAENPTLWQYLLQTAIRLPIKAAETGSALGLVDSDRKAVRKGYSKKARQSHGDEVSMLPL